MSEDGSVKTRVIRSGIWVGLGEAVIRVLSFLKSVILARLLTPEMFGLMGLCSIVIRTIETFTRPGIAQALIQREAPFEEARDTAFTLLFVRGIILASILMVAAPYVASFFESEDLDEMLRVLSAVFVIGGLANVNTINRQKELSYRSLTYLNQATTFIGTVITVGFAFWFRNVWALVIGQIATTICQAVLSYYFVGGRPRFSMDKRIAAELLSYGKFITASSAVIFIASSLDTAVIGKVLGAEQLGFYVLAFTLANLVTASLSKLASGIMMPAYSKIQSDLEVLRRAYLRTLSVVLLICLPATVGIFITAEYIVHNVYGDKWSNAIAPLQILVIFGMIRALASINGYLFEGIGKPQISLYVSLARLVILVPLIIPMTAKFGLVGSAYAITIVMGIQWFVFLVLVVKIVSVPPLQIVETVLEPLWKSVAMGVLVYLATFFVDGMSGSGLVLIILAGALSYLLLNLRTIAEVKRSIT